MGATGEVSEGDGMTGATSGVWAGVLGSLLLISPPEAEADPEGPAVPPEGAEVGVRVGCKAKGRASARRSVGKHCEGHTSASPAPQHRAATTAGTAAQRKPRVKEERAVLRAEPIWGRTPRDWWQKATLCAHKPCAGCGDAAGQPPAMGTAEQCCATSPPTATAAAITQPVRPLQCLWGTERQKGRAAAGAQRKAGQPDGTAAKESRFLSATMLPSLLQAQGGHCPAQLSYLLS